MLCVVILSIHPSIGSSIDSISFPSVFLFTFLFIPRIIANSVFRDIEFPPCQPNIPSQPKPLSKPMDALRKECAEWEQERNIRFLTIGTCFFARTICNSQNTLIPHYPQTHIITLQTLAEHTLPVLLGLAGRSRVVVTVRNRRNFAREGLAALSECCCPLVAR